MCEFQTDAAETQAVAALRSLPGRVLFDVFEKLQTGGLCVSHFCDAIQNLASKGQIRAREGSVLPEKAWPPPAQILRLRLECVETPDALGKTRQLPEGFTLFLDRILGRGGVGIVYLGEQVRLKRTVAVKVLRLKHVPEGVSRDWFIERFRREPRVIAQLNHPHIVQVIDCGEDGGDLWYAMEFLEGGTLSDRIRREGKLEPAEVRAYLKGMAEALGEAAAHGVLHRDVKPGNIFNRGIKLADFGLAKALSPADEVPAGVQTQANAMIGTPTYVAPERAAFNPGDYRSDMYSLGATMYYAATGQHLFDIPSENRQAWYRAHATTEPVPIGQKLPSFPKDLAQVIHRCLEKSPGKRFPTFHALVKELG